MDNSFSKPLICLIALVSLTNCASTSSSKNGKNDGAAEVATEAISAPFKDLGMMNEKIPPALAQITDPYATPTILECDWINYQIDQLNAVLGDDEIKPSNFDDRSTAEKGSDAAGDVAKSAAKSAATSWIPARGIVRKISGAEKAQKEFNQAVERGKIRRGYLRGLAYGIKCTK